MVFVFQKRVYHTSNVVSCCLDEGGLKVKQEFEVVVGFGEAQQVIGGTPPARSGVGDVALRHRRLAMSLLGKSGLEGGDASEGQWRVEMRLSLGNTDSWVYSP